MRDNGRYDIPHAAYPRVERNSIPKHKLNITARKDQKMLTPSTDFSLFVFVEVLRPSQQLRSCRAGQLPINTIPRQA